jgi:hypothetical protein
MRIVVIVVGVAAIGLIAAGVLGVAGAETTPAPAPAAAPLRTVSVQGVATQPLEPTASATAATAVYRQAMAAAVVDGQSKAQFLAEKTAATLGPVQSVAEGGGSIQCPGEEEYQGAQPDFGSGDSGIVVAPRADLTNRRAVPTVHKAPPATGKHRKRRRSARKAAVEPCTLSTQVALVYQLN